VQHAAWSTLATRFIRFRGAIAAAALFRVGRGDEQKTLTLLAALVCEPSRGASTYGCRSFFL